MILPILAELGGSIHVGARARNSRNRVDRGDRVLRALPRSLIAAGERERFCVRKFSYECANRRGKRRYHRYLARYSRDVRLELEVVSVAGDQFLHCCIPFATIRLQTDSCPTRGATPQDRRGPAQCGEN